MLCTTTELFKIVCILTDVFPGRRHQQKYFFNSACLAALYFNSLFSLCYAK